MRAREFGSFFLREVIGLTEEREEGEEEGRRRAWVAASRPLSDHLSPSKSIRAVREGLKDRMRSKRERSWRGEERRRRRERC